MNRIIVYGLIIFLAWQAYEQTKEQPAPAASAAPAPAAPGGY